MSECYQTQPGEVLGHEDEPTDPAARVVDGNGDVRAGPETGPKANLADALGALNALADYARDERAGPPGTTLGLTAAATGLLSGPAGHATVRSWVAVFADTIRLVNKVADEVGERDKHSDTEVDRVARIALATVAALTGRLDRAAAQADPSESLGGPKEPEDA